MNVVTCTFCNIKIDEDKNKKEKNRCKNCFNKGKKSNENTFSRNCNNKIKVVNSVENTSIIKKKREVFDSVKIYNRTIIIGFSN